MQLFSFHSVRRTTHIFVKKHFRGAFLSVTISFVVIYNAMLLIERDVCIAQVLRQRKFFSLKDLECVRCGQGC